MPLLVAASVSAAAVTPALPDDPKESGARPAGVPVIVSKARNSCFRSTVRANGILKARSEAMVIPQAEGFRVTQIAARTGDNVKAGQTLAELSRPDGTSMTLRAPANGTIIGSTATFGAVASPRAPEPIFSIAVDGDIELVADVPSIYAAKIAAGQTAQVELEDGRELLGRVRRPPSEINPVSQLGQVRIAIENDPSLRVGMFARATIDAARSCGVSVPRSAVYFRTEGASVQVVQDRVVETRKIQVGIMQDDAVEVKDGIREGEVVIANAGGSLRNGERVTPQFRDEVTGELQERRL
ncbi:MAG: efflux RND transporter periplasmic adaptor subunit [Xanthobacteraceae bacterium]